MSWLWPGLLLLLGALPLLIALYIWMLRRRRKFAVRYSSLTLVRAALPKHSRLRRHLPFALFTLALASLILALGRPVTTVSVPMTQATIVLALDVSRSMLATDIPPSRLRAAQAAALSFIESQQPGTQIGIVAFAGFAETVQPPTADQEALQKAIQRLTAGRGTAVGNGILESIDTIAEINPNVAPSVRTRSPVIAPTPVPQGAYAPAIIVVLTDGVTTTGPEPLDTAQQAVDRGVRVFTIGFGTEDGGIQFGGPGFGSNFRRGIDEETLQQIAEMTGGDYYSAESANELQAVFRNLPTHYITRQETIEISVAFVAAGALLAALAVALSLRWHQFP